MSSILTNMSAMTAIANLSATQKSLADVQNQISTGLKVSSAKDNAAYFTTAQNMRTQVSNLSAVSDSLNLASSVIGTATAGISTMKSVLDKIQADLVAAKQPGSDLTSISTDIKSLQDQLTSSVKSASFNGVNLLDGSKDATGVNVVTSVTGTGAATSVNTQNIATTGTNLSLNDAVGAKDAVAAKDAVPGDPNGTTQAEKDGTPAVAGSPAVAAQAAGGLSAVSKTNLVLTSTSTSDQIDAMITKVGGGPRHS